MFNKKLMLLLIASVFIIGLMNSVSADPPFVSTETSTSGLSIEPTFNNYLRTGEDYEFEVHVFNISNGVPIVTGIECYYHLYNNTGKHQLEMSDATVSHDFDYSFDVDGANFSRGCYVIKCQCNNSVAGGGIEHSFCVNDYGLELTEAEQSMFNGGMFILFVFLISTIIACFKVEHYIGKFIFYWISHLLMILITFSAWQFTDGYAIGYVGIAGVYKILFYFFIIAVIPMVFSSMAWIIYIHAFNEHFQKMLDKGEDTETAFKMAKKKSGGWMSGK